MTVSNQSNRTSAVGTGAEQTIPFTFPITNNSDIVVTSRITATGIENLMAETTDYTVINNGASGGSITTVTPFIASTLQIHIVRDTPNTQGTDLQVGGAFNADNVEGMSDKATKLTIENNDGLERTLKFPTTDPASSFADMPNSIDRASKNLTFDSAGKPTASVAVEEGSVSFSTIGTNIAEAANADTVVSLLSSNTSSMHVGDLITRSPWIDVRSYGAIGDGVADDGPAVTLAIESLTDGDILFFPDGTYLLTTYSQQDIAEKITICGSGSRNVTITGPDTSTSFIKLVSGGNLSMTGVGFSTFLVVIEGSTFNIDYIDISYCKADSVQQFYNDAGFASSGEVDYFNINNCQLSNITDVVIRFRSSVTKYVSMTNNDIFDCTGRGCIEIGSDDRTLSTNGCLVSGNRFNNIVTALNELWCVLVYGQGANISNNLFETIEAVQGSYSIFTKSQGYVINGNIIIDGSTATTADRAAIRIKGGDRGDTGTTPFGYSGVISNNSVRFTTDRLYNAIFISTGDVSCSGNVIEGAEIGIVSTGDDDIAICGNVMNNCGRGIDVFAGVNGSHNIAIANNTMTDFVETLIPSLGIFLATTSGTMTNVSISGNTMENIDDDITSATCIRIQTVENISNVSISGNIFRTADVGVDIAITSGTVTNISTQDNIFDNVTLALDPLTYLGTGSIARNNIGFVSENAGSSSLLSGNTTLVVAHGCTIAPTIVNVSFSEQATNDYGRWWIDTIGAENFTLNVSADPGASNLDFNWEARVR